jgi:acetylornithine/N-succinyldiaminopimelate aminotransferase
LLAGFIRAPFGDMEALENIAENNSGVVAVLLEPIQGEGGVNILPKGFLKALRKLCDKQQWLMMLDEVQTGNGRTGHYFAYQHEAIMPDVVTTAKGLGNGVPIGACLAHGVAADVFAPGNHGSTFGGNPLACAAALAVVDTIDRENLCEHAGTMGEFLLTGLQEKLSGQSIVREIRGQGLMIGIELTLPCAELVNQARARGLLINVTNGNTVRLLPPLIIDQKQAEQILETVSTLITQFESTQSS